MKKIKVSLLKEELKLNFQWTNKNKKEENIALALKEKNIDELDKLYDFIIKNIDNDLKFDTSKLGKGESVALKVSNAIIKEIEKEYDEIKKEREKFLK